MLSATVAREINLNLTQGKINAALAPLNDAVDVRWNELPKVEKSTLSAVAAHLRENENATTLLADALFHSNISVRRFVRKLLQNLKANAGPLARPLRARLETYWRETILQPTGSVLRPDRAARAQRLEQREIVDSAVECLARCDIEEFMQCLAGVLEYQLPRQEQLRQEEAQVRECKNAELEAVRKAYDTKKEQIWQEEYAHLGVTEEELPYHLSEELIKKIHDTPEGRALQEAQTAAMGLWFSQDDKPQLLIDEIRIVRQAFGDALSKLLEGKRNDEMDGDKVRAYFWRWLEADWSIPYLPDHQGDFRQDRFQMLYCYSVHQRLQWLGQRQVIEGALPLLLCAKAKGWATTRSWQDVFWTFDAAIVAHLKQDNSDVVIPETVTPEAIRSLSTGEQVYERRLEPLARMVEQCQLRAEGVVPESQNPVLFPVPSDDEDGKAAAQDSTTQDSGDEEETLGEWLYGERLRREKEQLAKLTGQFRTVEERVAALMNPSLINVGVIGTAQAPLNRTTLLRHWRADAKWQQQEEAIQEQALPKLRKLLLESRDAWRAARRGRSEVGPHPNPKQWALMNETERKAWVSSARSSQRYELESAIENIFFGIIELGGLSLYPQLLDELEDKGLRELQDTLLSHIALRLHNEHLSPELVPALQDAYRRWDRNCQENNKGMGDETSSLGGENYGAFAQTLYKIGTPEAMTLALNILESGKINPWTLHRLTELVRERSDYNMMLPLLRQCYGTDHDLVKLWEDLRNHHSERMPEFLPQLLELVAEATERERVDMPLDMLANFEAQPELFAPHFDLLMRCVESPLPHIARFCLARLNMIPDAPGDWISLCERVGEKLWSETPGLAKESAQFLGEVGARHAHAAPLVMNALSDALTLNSLPLLEAILRALTKIQKKQNLTLEDAAWQRLEQLSDEHPERLGKLCNRLL